MQRAEIHEVLARAGVEIKSGRMTCPKCDDKSVTASAQKGIAKCWKCDKVWTTNPDLLIQDWTWSAALLNPLAEACKEALASAGDACMWLLDRGIPIEDPDWMYENDLGAVPSDLNRKLSGWIYQAKKLMEDEAQLMEAERQAIKLTLPGLSSKQKAKANGRILALEEAIRSAKSSFETVAGTLSLLIKEDWRGAVVYVYRDEDGAVTSLNIRQVATEYETEDHPFERRVIRIQPIPNKRGIFGADDAQYAAGAAWGDYDRVPLIVEGEHNALSLRVAIRRWGLRFFLPVVAIGGKNGADIACLSRIAEEDGRPLIIYDNDEVNERTGLPGGHDLVEAITRAIYAFKTTTSTKDLDDWFKANTAATPSQFKKEVLGKAKYAPLSMDTVRKQVHQALVEDGLEPNLRESLVRRVIIKDLQRRAKIYQVDGYSLVALPDHDTGEVKLIPVRKGNVHFGYLASTYGLTLTKWIDTMGTGINILTKDAEPNSLHSLSHYNPETKTLYVNCYDNTFLRLRPTSSGVQIERLPNSTDGVLMQQGRKMTPWLPKDVNLKQILDRESGMRHRPGSLLDIHILSTVNYARDSDRYKQLLKSWITSVFFDHHKNRPVPLVEGPGAAGKGSLGAAVGYLLLGPLFTVTNSPSTGKELGELMSGVPFVVLDEWDNISKDTENAFKHITTGGKQVRRELYTTSTTVELSCDAATILTSNSNPMKQPGTSRRYIQVPVIARQQAPGDKAYRSIADDLLPSFMAARTEMWLDLIADLSKCVAALASTDPRTMTSFSMSDFGAFVQRVADHEGWGEEAGKVFTATEQQQEEQATNNLLLGSLIPELLRQSPNYIGEFASARAWSDRLQSVIAENDSKTKSLITPNYVAYVFKTHVEVFRRLFGMRTELNRHTKVSSYAFDLNDGNEKEAA